MNTTNLQVGNTIVQLLDDGDRIVGVIKRGKQWEWKTRGVWQHLVTPGRGVIDVGAYSGVYSIASALIGAHVIAFEPHPANYNRLRANATLNSVKIKMLKAAASDDRLPVALRMNKPATVMTDIASCDGDAPIQEIVQSMRIDELKMPAVGLIKIDVEGHEMRVLNGAAATIHEYHPNVIVEVLTEQADKQVAQFMEQFGYHDNALVMDVRNRLYRA